MNAIAKLASKAAGVELPDGFDLGEVLTNVADMRDELVNAVTGIDTMTQMLQVLVLIEAARAEHDGIVLDEGVRSLIAEIVIES